MQSKKEVDESIGELTPLCEMMVTGAIVVRGKTIPVARFLKGGQLPEGLEIIYVRLSPFHLHITEVK